ncbi:MAG TPA: hypothetical protein VFN87_18550, partial [Solirubrobacteraceae bacterium]|nr:hypothetical protein [Solirubrobacteraceae bacterium]
LAGARVAPNGWRRAKAMLHFDRGGELKRRFLLTAVQRNRNAQLRLRALQEIAASRDAEAFDQAIDIMGGWPRDERREGVKIMLQALAERRIGRRDQANAWIWRMAEYTREVHEEYAVQRWPETKRLLGLLVNSSGSAHARNARRLVHASRKEDRRLSAALLAAALAHTPEAEEALRGARTRMARKPAALARELLRNFPKGRRGSKRRRRKGGAGAPAEANGATETPQTATELAENEEAPPAAEDEPTPTEKKPAETERPPAADAEPPTESETPSPVEKPGEGEEPAPSPARRSRARSTTGAAKPAAKPRAKSSSAKPRSTRSRAQDKAPASRPADESQTAPSTQEAAAPPADAPPGEPAGQVDEIKRPRRSRSRVRAAQDAEEAA